MEVTPIRIRFDILRLGFLFAFVKRYRDCLILRSIGFFHLGLNIVVFSAGVVRDWCFSSGFGVGIRDAPRSNWENIMREIFSTSGVYIQSSMGERVTGCAIGASSGGGVEGDSRLEKLADSSMTRKRWVSHVKKCGWCGACFSMLVAILLSKASRSNDGHSRIFERE
jgi:hypothetical protein